MTRAHREGTSSGPEAAPEGGAASGPTAAAEDGAAAGVVVRAATVDDAAALVVLRVVMFEAMGTPPEQLADPEWRRAAHDWFVDRIGTPGVRVVVAEVDGQV
ncbi:MAG TPA: hypothetical protein VFI44_00870, partial [Ornithinibacter sp.]|nr:hypothetical protein [Ornithinibacter sp.]